jgi:2-polyprenyl-3-methyl-5-hydroxy-6-metoxy-1,4-benzoquinol methylase
MKCVACNSDRLTLKYASVRDLLFDAPGIYDYWECANCQTLRLGANDSITHADRYPPSYSYRKNASSVVVGRRSVREVIKRFLNRSIDASEGGGARTVIATICARFRRLISRMRTLGVGPPARGSRTLLDVGCGDGAYLEEMRRVGWVVTGIETSKAAVEICQQKGLPVFLGRIEEQNFEPLSFDIITLRHVIEHVDAPGPLLRTLAALLSDGGRLHITTPNAVSENAKKFGSDWLGLDVSRHEHVFSPKGIQRLIAASPFDVESARSSHRIGRFVIYASVMRKAGRNPYREKSTTKRIASYIGSALNRIKRADGDELVLVLRKKGVSNVKPNVVS